jgi:NADH-quinone oxidoreductase subunit C/D
MMAEQTSVTTNLDFAGRFPEQVAADSRSGYSGFIVKTEFLLEFARQLKADGYDYLSTLTGVDYFPEDRIEVVYHVFRSTGGSALVFKVQTSRANAVVPSVVAVWGGAEFQEREAWDLMGIRFDGHPDLRRILLWEGFAGHPLRKDWHEAYFEEDVKPFKNRWPDGHILRIEDTLSLGGNEEYPSGFDPFQWKAHQDDALYDLMLDVPDDPDAEMKTDRLVLNMGPQHPSTHGVFRMVVNLDGEQIVRLKPVMGYLHRSHDKIGERNTFLQNMPFTDRLDYISSMSNNFGYALAVEKLMGVQVPERADYIRVIMAELTRISSHIMGIGFLMNDLGAFFTPALYALEERELILDIFETVSGSRMMCNYFRFGGVVRDLQPDVLEKISDLVFKRLPRKIDELDGYLTRNEIVRTRCEGVGVLTPEQAINLSAGGPLLRASGVPYDIRRADPYSIYERFEFDVAYGLHGDIYDRYLVRMEEMRQSLRILQQAVKGIPEGPVFTGKPSYQVRVPAGEAYGRVEGPKGESGFYVVSNGKPNPLRYHVRGPSFINLHTLEPMSTGEKIADVVVILGSIDIVLGEVDR